MLSTELAGVVVKPTLRLLDGDGKRKEMMKNDDVDVRASETPEYDGKNNLNPMELCSEAIVLQPSYEEDCG